MTLANATASEYIGTLSADTRSTNTDQIRDADVVDHPVLISAGDGSVPNRTTLEFTYDLGPDVLT
ncbi:hypothetical protein [Halostagnicola kamekurae]|uniref:Uncharacterized protein n=1 Tax=Halostagnicola kamekurae TaxID=619731 RepID=A0A1I6UHR5_9EURY|nr:hypothetical protein [Halostagnicola kamekurae]SFT00985.1 hypothetical protein SAMN04488556_3884 [Halostagnicola kamekurae]